MTEYPIFIFMALMILGFGIFSNLSAKSIISAPMVFVAVGVVVSFLNIELLA